MKTTRPLRLVNIPGATSAPAPDVPSGLLGALEATICALVDARLEARLAAFKLAAAPAEPAYFDGDTSPLGRRQHNRLARSGQLGPRARKVARRWLVPVDDVQRHIEGGMAPAAAPMVVADLPRARPPADELAGLRAELGLQGHRGRR